MTPFVGQAANERVIARDFFGRESVVCGATSTALSATVYALAAHPPRAEFALITVEGEAMRWAADGAVADSAATLANVNDVIELHGINSIRNFRCVYAAPTSHLRVQYAR